MTKIKKATSSKEDILTKVVATAAVASARIANGRNVPVVIVEEDIEGKIKNLLESHRLIENGRCDSQWGMTTGYEYAILILSFHVPVEQKLILFFDVVKYGIIVEQILYSRCMYLMTGTEGMKFSEHMEDERILLEVDCEGFEEEWHKIYKRKYIKHIRKEYGLSKKEAVKMFEEVHNEMQKIKTLRIKA